MTDDPHRRSVIFSWRVKAIAVGQLVAGGGGPALIAYFGGGKTGHAAMSMILGAIILASTMLCFRFTRQARALPMVTAKGSSLRDQVRTIVADHNFAWLLVAKLAHLVAVAFGASTLAFFTLRVLELPDGYLALIIASSTVGIIAAAPVLTALSKRTGKQRTYWISVLIYATVHTSWWFAQPGEGAALMVVRGILMGIGSAGMMVIAQSLLADVMADDRARHGFSREGVYAGLYTTIEKLSFAVGIAMVGFLLGTAGYIEGGVDGVEQPQAALDMIRLSVSFVPAALAVFAAIMLARVRPSMAGATRQHDT
jgi:GPH family glycoside/pentoside/hexuronide:cation symporter